MEKCIKILVKTGLEWRKRAIDAHADAERAGGERLENVMAVTDALSEFWQGSPGR